MPTALLVDPRPEDRTTAPEAAPGAAPQLAKRRDVDAATTTVMLAEVPCDFTAEGILDQLRQNKLEDAMDYFYFPPECARGRARGRRMTGPFYAFINFTDPHWAQETKRLLDGKLCTSNGISWNMVVLRAEAQGVAQNLMKFRSVRRGDVSMFEDTWPHVRTERGLYAVHPVQAVKILHLEREVDQLRSEDKSIDFIKSWNPDRNEGKGKKVYDPPRRPAWRPRDTRGRDKWDDRGKFDKYDHGHFNQDWGQDRYPERYPPAGWDRWAEPTFDRHDRGTRPHRGHFDRPHRDNFDRGRPHRDRDFGDDHYDGFTDMRWHELPGLMDPIQHRGHGPSLRRLEAEAAHWFDDVRDYDRVRDLDTHQADSLRRRPPARPAPPPQY